MSDENWARAFVASLMDDVRKDIASQITGGSRNTQITLEDNSRILIKKLKEPNQSEREGDE